MRMLLAVLTLVSSTAMGQTYMCVDVPKGHKIAFVPWFVPVEELEWTFSPVTEPAEEEEEPVCVGGGLTFGGPPDPSCDQDG